MGSCGSYSASLSINYSIKTTATNTIEQCSNYLQSRKSPLCLTSTQEPTEELIQSLLDSGTYFLLNYDDYAETWEPDDDPLNGFTEYEDTDKYCLHIAVTPEQLVNCDLSIIPNDKYRNIINSDFTVDDPILDVAEDIYWENDNSCIDFIKVTPTLIAKLSRPKAKLVLIGNGSGE